MKPWCWIDTGFNSGAFNMALDEALFRRALEQGDFVPTLRIYGFHRPAITYGYSQKISKHWLEDPFYESSKRITGGGLVFHGKDLTYSFVSGCRWHTAFPSLRDSYRAFHEIVRQAFAEMDIRADFVEERRGAAGLKNLCFFAPVRHDLLFQGKKVAGAAQKRSGEVFLHQGSVNFRVFLKEEEEYLPFYEKFKIVFLSAFKEYFGVEFKEEKILELAGQSGLGEEASECQKAQLRPGSRSALLEQPFTRDMLAPPKCARC